MKSKIVQTILLISVVICLCFLNAPIPAVETVGFLPSGGSIFHNFSDESIAGTLECEFNYDVEYEKEKGILIIRSISGEYELLNDTCEILAQELSVVYKGIGWSNKEVNISLNTDTSWEETFFDSVMFPMDACTDIDVEINYKLEYKMDNEKLYLDETYVIPVI